MQLTIKEWEKLKELFLTNVKELEEGVIFQLTTLISTFSEEEADLAFETLRNKESKIEDIDLIVKKIEFLGRKEFEDAEKLKSYAENVATNVKRYIKKTNKRVDFLFKKMQGYIKQVDFFSIEKNLFGNPDPITQESIFVSK